MYGFGGKAELVALQLPAGFEKVVEERAPIAFEVAVARDEAGHAALLLHRDLNELAVAQKTIHAGVFRAGRRRRRFVLLRRQWQKCQENETGESQRTSRERKGHVRLQTFQFRSRDHYCTIVAPAGQPKAAIPT